MTGDARFSDEGHPIDEFVTEPIAVRCPRCDAGADLVPWGGRGRNAALAAPTGVRWVRFVWDHDGGALSFWRRATIPCFGYLLWYRVETSQGVIWAYHGRHLELLGSFVAADPRQRSEDAAWRNRSYLSRLPKW